MLFALASVLLRCNSHMSVRCEPTNVLHVHVCGVRTARRSATKQISLIRTFLKPLNRAFALSTQKWFRRMLFQE